MIFIIPEMMPYDVYYALNDASLLIPTDNEDTIFLQYFTVFLQYWLKPHLLVAKELSKNHRKDRFGVRRSEAIACP